jgi:hypothetical protein
MLFKVRSTITPVFALALLGGCASDAPDHSEEDLGEVEIPLASTIQPDESNRLPIPLPARMPDGSVLCRYDSPVDEQGVASHYPVTYRFDLITRALAENPELAQLAGVTSVATCKEAERVSAIWADYIDAHPTTEVVPPEQVSTAVEEPAPESVQKVRQGVSVSGAVGGEYEGIVRLRGNCSGFYITNQHIVTAAHCFASSGSQQVQIYHASRGASTHFAYVHRHPNYTNNQWSVDIAVVQLAGPDAWATTKRRFRLYTGTTSVGKGLKIYGYGITGTGASSTLGTLRGAPNNTSFRLSDHTNGYFKANAATARICSGDSGGPAIDESSSSGYPIVWGDASRILTDNTGDYVCPNEGEGMVWTKMTTNVVSFIEPVLRGQYGSSFSCTKYTDYAKCW